MFGGVRYPKYIEKIPSDEKRKRDLVIYMELNKERDVGVVGLGMSLASHCSPTFRRWNSALFKRMLLVFEIPELAATCGGV